VSDALRVLVTGATGLVGAHVVARLLKEPSRWRVRALVRTPNRLGKALEPFHADTGALEVCEGDVADAKSVESAVTGCDAVVHAAGIFSHDTRDRPLMQRTNVEGTRLVLAAAHGAGVDPIVYVSSYLALFPPRAAVQSADDPVTHPKGAYARTKADAERIARALQRRKAPVVCLYPGAIHGPYDPSFGASPAYIAASICRREMLVNRAGRTYLDVRDLAELVLRTLERGLGPRRIMCGGNYVYDADVHALLRELTGRDIRPQRIPGSVLRIIGRLGDAWRVLSGREPQLTYEAACVVTRSVPCDDRDALALLGRPYIDFRESLQDLLAWMVAAGRLSPEEAGPALVARAEKFS